jgi:hypothetical protein
MLTKNHTRARDLAQRFAHLATAEPPARRSFDARSSVTYISCNTAVHQSMPKAVSGFPCLVRGDERDRLAVFRSDRPERRRFPNLPSGKTDLRRHDRARALRESRPL